MAEEKTYTIEEAKAHGKEFIRQQAEILRTKLERKGDYKHVENV